MGRDGAENAPPAFDFIEEGVVLLKRAPHAAWAVYAAGTLGFLWAFLTFFAYMSRNARAPAHLAEYSFILAAAYVAMKACHAAFFTGLMERLLGEPATPPTPAKMGRFLATQALVQPLGLFLLPAAALVTLPLPWTVAFLQNVQWIRGKDDIREWWGRSWRLALLWPVQNLQLHLFLVGVGLVLFANIAVTFAAVPYLLKALFGVETVFSRSSHALINSTSFMVVAALTWACLDPLIKALFALRCFRGESVRTGLDLRIAIARSRAAAGGRSRSSVKALAAAVLLAAAAAPAIAAPSADPAPPAAVPQASPAELEGLLEKEIADSRYSWRMPEKIEPSDGEANFLVRWIEKAADKGVDGLRWVKRAVERFLKWLDKLFGNKDHGRSGRPDGFTFASIPPFYLLAALLALIVLAIGAGLWRRRPAAPVRSAVAVAAPAPRMPDIASEDVRPDDLPETEWLRLMEELRRKGEHRLAIRALFLAQLSVSARQGWLVVARAKSNRDYQREVALKSRRDPEAADAFRESCLRFDRIWYGQHAVTEEDWAVCLANFGRLGGHGI